MEPIVDKVQNPMILPNSLPRYLSAMIKRTRNNIPRLSVYRRPRPRLSFRSPQLTRPMPAAHHSSFPHLSSHDRSQNFEALVVNSSIQLPSTVASRSSRPPVGFTRAVWNPSPSPNGQDRIWELDSPHINAVSAEDRTSRKLLPLGGAFAGRTDRLLWHSVGRVEPSHRDDQADGAVSDDPEPIRPSPDRRVAVRPLLSISAVTPIRETYDQASRFSPRRMNHSLAPSHSPASPRQLDDNVRPGSDGWEETSTENDVPPTSNVDTSAEIHLDGQILGQWVIDYLQWSLTRPQIGINSVNSRANPTWPGQTNFMET
jgi:hypothetical protein